MIDRFYKFHEKKRGAGGNCNVTCLIKNLTEEQEEQIFSISPDFLLRDGYCTTFTEAKNRFILSKEVEIHILKNNLRELISKIEYEERILEEAKQVQEDRQIHLEFGE